MNQSKQKVETSMVAHRSLDVTGCSTVPIISSFCRHSRIPKYPGLPTADAEGLLNPKEVTSYDKANTSVNIESVTVHFNNTEVGFFYSGTVVTATYILPLIRKCTDLGSPAESTD